jgi:hypothetical protein
LKKMTGQRVAALIPPRDVRKRQRQEKVSTEAYANSQSKGLGDGGGMGASTKTSSTVNFARLAINVRQLIEAREGMKELALASFSELRESFVRAGLLTLGDQLRWANVCSEFELFEDELAEEVYIGLKAGSKDFASSAEGRAAEDQKAREVYEQALDNPEFLQTIDKFSDDPGEFLRLMKQNVEENEFNMEDAERMRQVYKAAGMDIDETLEQMTAAMDQLPPAQQEVVEYMRQLLSKPPSDEVNTEKKEASEVNA